MNRTVLFTASRGYGLTSSRSAIIQRFLDAGWNVVVATSDDPESRRLVERGVHLEPVNFNRGRVAAVADFRAYRRLRSICRAWLPGLMHNFHAKPVMAGTMAARRVLRDSVRVVNTITGLGHAFIVGGSAARLASFGYRIALLRAEATVFQNRDDRALFVGRGWLPRDRARLISGSGVDVNRYEFCDRTGHDPEAPVVIMLGRLLRQKGIHEFISVSERIRARWPNAQFVLAGEEDSVHPDRVNVKWLRARSDVKYVGHLADIRPLLEAADLILFPSYREGVPRVVMEAAASGLPTVAFDVPGVREAVHDGETGYLVPEGNVEALAAGVGRLLGDPELRRSMGTAARRLAEEAFDIRAVQHQYMSLYRELGADI